jgi:hypothetical protein
VGQEAGVQATAAVRGREEMFPVAVVKAAAVSAAWAATLRLAVPVLTSSTLNWT